MSDAEQVERVRAFIREMKIRNLPIVYLELGEVEMMAIYRNFRPYADGVPTKFMDIPLVLANAPSDGPSSMVAVVDRGGLLERVA